MAADIGEAFQNTVHAGLRPQRKLTSGAFIIDFTQGNTRLNGLPHGLASEQRWHRGDEEWNEPEQHHVAGVGRPDAGHRDGQQRHDGNAGAKQLSDHQRCSVPSHQSETHSQLLLLLPFFHGPFEWIFRSGKPVAVRIGE